jgi:Ca2+:H+ antiporter
MAGLTRNERIFLLMVAVLTALAGTANYGAWAAVPRFALATLALAGLAWIVSFATEALGERFGPAVTGMLQSTLGNLPELFVVVFALKKAELVVAQTAIVGSVLANALLVLGLVVIVGARRAPDGLMRFSKRLPRDTATLLQVTVFILVLLGLSLAAHDPASHHVKAISAIGAVCLLVVYLTWVVPYLRADARPARASRGETEYGEAGGSSADAEAGGSAAHVEAGGGAVHVEAGGGAAHVEAGGSAAHVEAGRGAVHVEAGGSSAASRASRVALSFTLALLLAGGAASAFVSEWFIAGLQPAITRLHLSQAFAGLVIVAIASNAVENAAGLNLAYKRRSDLAISVVKNSVAQIAAFLFPALVLISLALPTTLTFAIAPVYVGALALTALALWQVAGDGQAAEFEGWALVALYVILATLTLYE